MKKRVLNFFLSVLLLFSVSTNAMAVGEDQNVQGPENPDRAADYQLKDSTFFSTPPYVEEQNCYGYAVGQTNRVDPGYYATGSYDYWYNTAATSAKTTAELVKLDLKSSAFDKPCVAITTVCPTNASLRSGQTAICVRVGTCTVKGHKDYGEPDFHLMRLESDGKWRHKPGDSSILTYNGQPTTSRNWTNEGRYDGVDKAGWYTYSGPIYFILFSSSHGSSSETHKYTGNNYHSGSRHYYQYADICSVCGDQTNFAWESVPCSGPPCAGIMSIDPEVE